MGQHSKTRTVSEALRRSRTHFSKLPKVLPSHTCGTHKTVQDTSGPKTHWKMSAAAPLLGGTQPRSWAAQCVTLPVRSELLFPWRLPLCSAPRGPGERRAWGEAMHNTPIAALAGTLLLAPASFALLVPHFARLGFAMGLQEAQRASVKRCSVC